MVWTCLLLLLTVGLEKLGGRPFVATRWGVVLALLLGGQRLQNHLYKVPELLAIGFVAAAQTWGETIIITPGLLAGPQAAQTLAHEACHVAQYRRLTSLGFWLLYLWQWLYGLYRTRNAFRAYWEIPLEREARRAADPDTRGVK